MLMTLVVAFMMAIMVPLVMTFMIAFVMSKVKTGVLKNVKRYFTRDGIASLIHVNDVAINIVCKFN